MCALHEKRTPNGRRPADANEPTVTPLAGIGLASEPVGLSQRNEGVDDVNSN